MISASLKLYVREGCCLCAGLEQSLKDLDLHQLYPQLQLVVIDIDGKDIPQSIRQNYDLEVPVMVLSFLKTGKHIELPRVSPRLKDKALLNWLKKFIPISLDSK